MTLKKYKFRIITIAINFSIILLVFLLFKKKNILSEEVGNILFIIFLALIVSKIKEYLKK